MGQLTYNLASLAAFVYRFFLIFMGLAILTTAPAAAAKDHISKVSIDNLVENNTTILDWKTNELVIPFDLPETVWVDHVEFLVSARPTGQLRQRRNLQLRLNGSEPIILKAQGQRFDARVRLETKHLRRRGNRLFISGIATSPSCPGPNSAGWDISQDRSMLVYYGRNMTRDLNFRDLNALWPQNLNAHAPNIGLKVIGTDSFRHESLITQGVTLRTGAVPKLNTVFSGNKLDIIAGLRGDVRSYIRNEKGRQGSGSQIILDEQRPPRLIITGDTAEELRASVNAFARHKLPITRRTITTANELSLQPVLSSNRSEFDKTHALSDAGVLTAGRRWLTPAQTFSFDTSYAAQRTGRLTLRLNGSDRIAKDSTLDVTLNGRKLGQTQIDKARKTVRFDIPEGYLIGSNNEIRVQPDLKPSPEIEICSVAESAPQFSLGMGSKISLSSPPSQDIHDVSNFAALSGPFARADSLLIYGTARTTADSRSALQVMGRLALISGRAWIEAEYVSGNDAFIPPTDKLLIIGPKINKMDDLLANAPKALRLALSGKKVPDIKEDKIASILKVAALNEQQAFELAAASSRQGLKPYTSGLIALYDDQASRRTIGVITTRRGASFKAAAANLLKPAIWNSLQGSVAQWDGSNAVMLQTAQPKSISKGRSLKPLQGLGTFDWDNVALLNRDWSASLRDIWSGPRRAFDETSTALWADINSRWDDIFNPSPVITPPASQPRGHDAAPRPSIKRSQTALRQRITPIPVPNVKPKPASGSQTVNAKPLPLRGAYDPESFSAATARNLISFEGIKSSVLGGIGNIKAMGTKAYGDFEAWGNQINNQRQSSGKHALVPTPILALLFLVFTGLILLSIAAPHQRRY